MTYLTKMKGASIFTLVLSTVLVSIPDRLEAGESRYLGDIMIVGFNFCPRGWTSAEGQLLPINQNQSLYSLLGTNFGGDGRTTFALPDFRGRVAMGQGNGPTLTSRNEGNTGGSEKKYMTEDTMANHKHLVNANNLDGDKGGPGGKLLAAAPTGGSGNETIYSLEASTVTMSAVMIDNTGGNQGIDTQDPTLSLFHCIATTGIFPSRN